MRVKDIKVSIGMRVDYDSPDDNGIIYTKEAIINAVNNAKNLPIEVIKNDGTAKVVGVGSNISLEDNGDYGMLKIEGLLWYGGTEEMICDMGNNGKTVTSMEIVGVGITD